MSDTSVPDLDGRRKGGLLKKLIFFPLGAAVLAGGGFGAGMYFSGQRLSPSEEVLRLIEQQPAASVEGESGPTKVAKEIPEAPVFETRYYEFPEPLTTNLKGSTRFLQIGIGVSTQYDATVISNVETHAMALRSDMLGVISGFAEQDVEGAEGRDKLASALQDAINRRLESLEGFGGIEGVFFPSFVLQ